MQDLKLIDTKQLNRFAEKISEPIKKMKTDLDTVKNNLSNSVGYRKFNSEHITAKHTIADRTRNLCIEGNSIVNLASGLRSTELGVLVDNVFTVTATEGRRGNLYFDNAKGQIKNKETYTIIMNITKNTLVGNTSSFKFNLNNYSIENYGYFKVENGFTGTYMKVIRTATTDVIDTPYLETYTNQTSGELEISNIYILKGDWSNKTIPSYFEGLKSVGDLQVDGLYKVDILSKNKNLCNVESISFENNTGDEYMLGKLKPQIQAIKLKPNTTYTLSYSNTGTFNSIICFLLNSPRIVYSHNELYTHCITDKNGTSIIISGNGLDEITTTTDIYLYITLNSTRIPNGEKVCYENIQLEENTLKTSYELQKTDKKQILLQEPLHKINDNIKDTIVFIDGKWKIKRMCHFKTFDKNSPFSIVGVNSKFAEFILDTDRYKSNADFALKSNLFLDKVAIGSGAVKNPIGIGVTTHNALRLRPVDNDNLTKKDVTDWFGDKTLELLYELETPFYEDIEQDISVDTYDELTYVYADTIIPTEKLSFSTLVNLGSTVNGLESSNTKNQKLVDKQEDKLTEHAYSILENDIRLCMLELGL